MEGAGHTGHDPCHGSIHVSQHVACGQPQYPVAILLEKVIANHVALWSIAATVPLAVNLDGQCSLAAEEVADIGADRVLPPNLEAGATSPQSIPQYYFG